MPMFGARPIQHRVLRRWLPTAILGLLGMASLTATGDVAAQSLDWQRNPATGHWYAVVYDMPWAEGEAYAVSLGGHLATINDQAEDRWISANFGAEVGDALFVGLNDLAEEGTFVWASGEPVTYTHWVGTEPNDGGGGPETEDIVVVNSDFDQLGELGWADQPVDAGGVYGLLIEVVSPVTPPAGTGAGAQSLDWQRNPGTGHWYAIVGGMTWVDGQAYAIRVGGNLATINDRDEDVWISATFPGDTLIGFNDLAQEGNWVWASGEPVSYTNWLAGQPAHGADVAQINFTDHRWAGWNDTHLLDLLIEVVSAVAPPAEMSPAQPIATPTTPPTARPTAAPTTRPIGSPSPSPAAASSAPPSTGAGGIGPGGGGPGGGGYRQPGALAPGITTTIPGPADVSVDPSVVGTNLLLAALVMVMLTIATELLNRSLGELEPMLSGRFTVVRRLQRALARLDAATIQRLAARRHRLVDVARLAGIAAFYGIAFAFLDPTWDPLTVPGVWLVVMMAFAVGVVGLGGDIAAWAVGRRWGVVGDLEIRAGSLLAAVGSTLISRAVVLVPGIMIGSPEVIEVDPDRVDRRRLGMIAAVGVGTVLLIGLASWGLTSAIAVLRLSSGSLDPALSGVEAFLLLVFAFAVQNGFVQLLSLRQSGGLALRRTHPVWWGLALLVVTFTLWHTLVNPTGDLASALRTTNVVAFLVAAGVVLFVSLAVWVGTRLAWLRLAQPADSGAVRAIDLQRTFRLGPKALAEKLGVDTGLAKALRWHLGIEDDPACRHDFVFGRTKLPMYSDRALERMREAIAGGANLGDVRRAYQAAGRP